jgi:hypothetical protein
MRFHATPNMLYFFDETRRRRIMDFIQPRWAPTPSDELEVAAATPVSLALTLSEQRIDAKAIAVLRDAERAAAGAPCSPEEPPAASLHSKPRSAHLRLYRGGCAPNRCIHPPRQ